MPEAPARALRIDDEPPPVPPRPRRTVTITGCPEKRIAPPPPLRPLEVVPRGRPSGTRIVTIQRRRPPPRGVERLGPRPDRMAMWAVVMALFLILVTLTSAHGL
jgi:hypothetical protein